ncbi:RNA ligase family protein [Streptomyces sp. NPDC004528]|uniref:RNA ligase family protein n=1 Tax=Streptomyces sp. NPDC004528 TaxID=3154550 RepID=UPI0033AA956A
MTDVTDFKPWPKIPRFNRDYVITEKIDGTNSQVAVKKLLADEDANRFLGTPGYNVVSKDDGLYVLRAGSRKRWIAPNRQKLDGMEALDNFGFAAWVADNASALANLGEGTHYGEWYGRGIQHGYGMLGRKFALFNTSRWGAGGISLPDGSPAELTAVPELARVRGHALNEAIRDTLRLLRTLGSVAEPGGKAEGIVIYSVEARQCFKALLENDDLPKGLVSQ